MSIERKDIRALSTQQLRDQLQELNSVIEDVDCFGTNDLVLRCWIEQELELRRCAVCEEFQSEKLEDGICNPCFIFEKEGGING